jgi:hypothetical protein
MRTRGTRIGAMVALLVWCGWIGLTSISTATMDIQKQAKAVGADAKNCQFCHTVSLPKKGEGAKQLNERGQWLQAQKEKKGAKEVDGAWVKDYPGK